MVAYNLLRALSNFDIAQFPANKQQATGQWTFIESRGDPDLIIVSQLSDMNDLTIRMLNQMLMNILKICSGQNVKCK